MMDFMKDDAEYDDGDDNISKLDMEKRLHSNDENITLMYPEKTKSNVWNLFRVIMYKNIRQHYVTCLVCNCVLVYKSRTGTASLLRHNCYKRMCQQISQINTLSTKNGTAKWTPPSFETATAVPVLQDLLMPVVEPLNIKTEADDITEVDNDDDNYSDDMSEEPPEQPLDLYKATNQEVLDDQNMLDKCILEDKIRKKDSDIVIVPHHKRKSRIWTRFELVYYRGIKQNYVQCMGCGCLLSYKKKTGSASVIRHRCSLKRKLLISQPDQPDTSRSTNSPNSKRTKYGVNFSTESISNILSLALPMNAVTSNSTGRYFQVSSERLTELVVQLILYTTKDMGSIEMFDNSTFRAMMQIMLNIGSDYGRQNVDTILPNSTLIKTLLKNLQHEIEDDLKVTINSNELCFTFNIWAYQGLRKLSMIGHFINEQFELKKIYLGTETLSSLEQEDVAEKVQKILANYTEDAQSVLNKSIIVIEKDNESIKLALSNSTSILCSCDQVYNVLESALVDNSEYSTLTQAFSNVSEVFNALKENEDFCSGYPYLTTFTNEHLLSNLRMLDGFNTNHEQINEYVAVGNEDIQKLFSEIDKDFIQNVIDLLKPFQQCIDRLSSDDHQTTLNEVYLWKKKLERLCLKSESDSTFIKSIKQALQTKIAEELIITDYHAAALFLDPNFKHLKFLTQSERDHAIETVRKYVDTIITSPTTLTHNHGTRLKTYAKNSTQSSNSSTLNSSTVNDMFLEFMDCSVPDTEEEISKKEIRAYLDTRLSEPQTSLDFWRLENPNFPNLRKLARNILNIPACSMSSKLKFGETERTFEAKRKLLEPDELSSILFLHQNISNTE